jgi:alpha-tubulin suppressor-like RCC1 family protein
MTRRCLFCIVVGFTIALPASASAEVRRRGDFFGGGEGYEQVFASGIKGLENVKVIQASNASSYFLRADGTVWAIGDGLNGELGNGSTSDSLTPVKVVFPEGTTITAIGEAKNEGFAIDSTGQAWAWGAGGEGSLCLGTGGKREVPVKVPGVTGAKAVQGGENHVLWLLANGTVKSCGTNAQGQLGLGEGVERTNTATLIPELSHVVQISAGDRTSAALTESGQVYVWGSNRHGEVGIGSTSQGVYSPALVPLPGPASEVSSGGDLAYNGHTLALVGGTLYSWGTNGAGQLGDGTTTDRSSPVDTGLSFVGIAASGAYSMGLDSKGGVWAWGSATEGELGTGATFGRVITPTQIDSGASMISATAQNSLDG